MFAPAGQPELVRSNQKDVYYLGFLREGIGQIFRNVRGPFSWIKWKTELDLFADICYFGLTTISGYQTLGEEYCNIVQVDTSKTRIPSTLLRGSLVFLYALGPYLIDKALTRLELWLQTQGDSPYGIHPRVRNTLSTLIPIVRAGVAGFHWRRSHSRSRSRRSASDPKSRIGVERRVVNWTESEEEERFHFLPIPLVTLTLNLSQSKLDWRSHVHRTHLALFYLNGIFYHIAKRITGIQYLLVRNSLRNDGSRPTYRLLGYLSVVQMIITLILTMFQHLKSGKPLERLVSQDKPPATSINTSSGIKCALCLEKLQEKTATPCGHLFCWKCITEWCASKTRWLHTKRSTGVEPVVTENKYRAESGTTRLQVQRPNLNVRYVVNLFSCPGWFSCIITNLHEGPT
ncbi:hypothetical protein pdam_00011427 [Pocillopora damicornis]|uniref:RING-type E3 ubiquitin transferase n=1 Tax=Pocillopora damicornis TaxID=46731 RepID=A0A3M6URH5_POCDA|nr:hypothetical protein pdam_00011427 [Pocillopora damicornis]